MPERDWASLQPGRKSLKHMARILEQRPRKDDHELSHLTRCLADFRAEMIASQDGNGSYRCERKQLVHLNAIISVVMGMHFPLGHPPWEEFAKAQSWLDQLVGDVEHLAG